MPERSPHLLTLGPSDEPHWARLVVHPIGDVWTTILVGAHEPPPEPGRLTGLCLFGKTPDEEKGAALLKLMWVAWDDVFRRTLGQNERNLVSELIIHRNNWAHQVPFSIERTYRALDSAWLLLTAISAPQADEIKSMKMELLLEIAEAIAASDPGSKIEIAPPQDPADDRTSPSERGEAYTRFFLELIDDLRKRGFTGVRYYQSRNSIDIAAGSRVRYAFVFGRGERVRAAVSIDLGEADKNKRRLDALAKDKRAMEAEFGEPLEWEPLNHRKGSRIAIYRAGRIEDDYETLQEIKEWASDRLLKLKKVFDPRLARSRSLG